MPTRIIAELGSTTLSKWVYCKEAIDRCAELGVDAVKFQLFPNLEKFTKSGNVWMPPELYLQCAEYGAEQGIGIAASVFGPDEFDFLIKTDPAFVKFAYSMQSSRGDILETLTNGIEAIVSCDVMTDKAVPYGATKLFCIPQYPVYYQICFDEIFPRFDGFSSHTLGFEQDLNAIAAGAKTIEKHITLSHGDINVPDSHFALPMGDFASLMASIEQFRKDGIA